jgi:hypothetical protein
MLKAFIHYQNPHLTYQLLLGTTLLKLYSVEKSHAYVQLESDGVDGRQ